MSEDKLKYGYKSKNIEVLELLDFILDYYYNDDSNYEEDLWDKAGEILKKYNIINHSRHYTLNIKNFNNFYNIKRKKMEIT